MALDITLSHYEIILSVMLLAFNQVIVIYCKKKPIKKLVGPRATINIYIVYAYNVDMQKDLHSILLRKHFVGETKCIKLIFLGEPIFLKNCLIFV